MKKGFKKLIALSAVAIFALSGCGNGSVKKDFDKKTDNNQFTTETYAFIAKDIKNTYMQKIYEGFETACRKIGVTAVYKAPDSPTPEKQKTIIRELTEKNVKGIAIAANDADLLQPELQAAMEKGIKVISLDSAVNKDSRQLHIQQADPEQTGRSLIRSAYDMIGGNGGIAILTSTDQATNQNLWIDYMKKEIAENPQKYASTPIVKIAYGDDDITKSKTETNALLQDPNIKIIIAPTAVGIVSAAEVLQKSGSDVKLTGLGMPSAMAEYIENGICEKMFLWNPVDIGFLAGYSLNALAENSNIGNPGTTFYADRIGTMTVQAATDGGSEVVLGDLIAFDKSNIAEWKDVF